MVFGDRAYHSSLLLPKSLGYPESAYEALVTNFELASAYFAGQWDATLIAEEDWPLDHQDVGSSFAQLTGRTVYILQTGFTELFQSYWDKQPSWDTIILHLAYALGVDTVETHLKLSLDDGVNPVDSNTKVYTTGNQAARGLLAQGTGGGVEQQFNFDVRLGIVEVQVSNIDETNNPIEVTPSCYAVYNQNTAVPAPIRPILARIYARKDY